MILYVIDLYGTMYVYHFPRAQRLQLVTHILVQWTA